MFCPNCGKQLPENGNFCPNCGEKLMAAPQAQPVQPVQVPPVQVPPVSVQPEVPAQPVKKKSKKGLIIGLSVGGGVLVILLAVIVAVFVLLGGTKEPTMTCGGMTFSYGMTVDLDDLERRFPDMETRTGSLYILDGGAGLIIREDPITGETTVVGMVMPSGSVAKMNGVRAGASVRSFCSAFPQAEHPVLLDGTENENAYSFYIYDGKVYNYAEYMDQLMAYRIEGDEEASREMQMYALMLSAMVRDGKVISISFGDVMALQQLR